MGKLKQARAICITLIIAALTVRVLWWTLLPLVPYLVLGAGLITVIGFLWFRTTRL